MGKTATIRDVAKLAGVSLATVSRVLNDADYPVSPELKAKVDEERASYLNVLRERGEVFMKEAAEAGLSTCPYDSGFFVTIPCEYPEKVGEILQTMNIFTIPLGPGVRVSVASNTVEECRMMPAKIKEAITLVRIATGTTEDLSF